MMKVVCIASFKCTDDCVTGEQGQLYQFLYHVQDRTDANEMNGRHTPAGCGLPRIKISH